MSEREWSPLDHIFTIQLSDKGNYPYASRVFRFDDGGIAEAQKWLCELRSRDEHPPDCGGCPDCMGIKNAGPLE